MRGREKTFENVKPRLRSILFKNKLIGAKRTFIRLQALLMTHKLIFFSKRSLISNHSGMLAPEYAL